MDSNSGAISNDDAEWWGGEERPDNIIARFTQNLEPSEIVELVVGGNMVERESEEPELEPELEWWSSGTILGGTILGGKSKAKDGGNSQGSETGGDSIGAITEFIQNPSECAFDKEQSGVCSPDHVIEAMRGLIKAKSGNAGAIDGAGPSGTAAEAIVAKAKDITGCKSEACVIESKEFNMFANINHDQVLEEFFKPKGPDTRFGLLSNFNIDHVLAQLNKKYPDFLHIPFQMRDFEAEKTELAKTDLAKEFAGGIRCFGVVMNTDWSSGRGIHWYCLYGEKTGDRITLDYFNSSGRPPLPETQTWLHKNKHMLESKTQTPVDIRYTNGVRFQDDEHSCGVYCLMYILFRLDGVGHRSLNPRNFGDPIMHKARKALFRP